AAIVPEILAVSGLEQRGVRIGSLAMSFGIDGRPAPPPAPQAMGGAPPAGQGGGGIPAIHIRPPGGGMPDIGGRAKSALIGWAIRVVIALVVLAIVSIFGL